MGYLCGRGDDVHSDLMRASWHREGMAMTGLRAPDKFEEPSKAHLEAVMGSVDDAHADGKKQVGIDALFTGGDHDRHVFSPAFVVELEAAKLGPRHVLRQG